MFLIDITGDVGVSIFDHLNAAEVSVIYVTTLGHRRMQAPTKAIRNQWGPFAVGPMFFKFREVFLVKTYDVLNILEYQPFWIKDLRCASLGLLQRELSLLENPKLITREGVAPVQKSNLS